MVVVDLNLLNHSICVERLKTQEKYIKGYSSGSRIHKKNMKADQLGDRRVDGRTLKRIFNIQDEGVWTVNDSG